MKLAITSFVCSIVSLVIFWWLGAIGVIFGCLAVCQNHEGESNQGVITGLSTAGIVIGCISVVFGLVLISSLRGM